MLLHQEQQLELNIFIRETEQECPDDFLQFAANYFNKRLEQQRDFIKKKEPLVKEKYMNLFAPDRRQSSLAAAPNTTTKRSRNDFEVLSPTKFKSPFTNLDPHSIHTTQDGDAKNSDVASISPSQNQCEFFNSSFKLNATANKRTASPLDPMSVSANNSNSSLARMSIVNIDPPVRKSHDHLPINFNALRRTSVSGETFQPEKLDDWTPAIFSEKTGEQLERLQKAVGKNFLFNKLDIDSRKLVINALEEKYVEKGHIIIQQGNEGDYFYIVESGKVSFHVDGSTVNTAGPGSSFGELALMYNSPRAATVIADSECVLWELDRITFRNILVGSSFKKRVIYDNLLKTVPILNSLTIYDRAKLADALDTEIYEPGQVIIAEGDVGENFYLIEYGTAEVSKNGKGVVATLKTNDYFGEVALLNNLPRQATITTTSKTKVATLGKSGFQRLLGPAVDVLRLNDPSRAYSQKAVS